MPIACKTKELEEITSLQLQKKQRTLRSPISARGIGLFTGESVTLELVPAEEGTGIVFERTDLEGGIIPASLDYLVSSSRCTMLKKGDAVIQTIEHLMAAIYASGISNLLIKIDAPEIPIFDGSSLAFMDLIEKVGIVDQSLQEPIYTLKAPVYFSHNETQLIALPSHEYRISYTLHYPHSPFLRSQFYTTVIDQQSFVEQIAPCRTFSLYEEVMPLLEKNLIKGGSLENGVIVKGNEVMNPEGVRFPDEMARHKVLDLVGDMALMGLSFHAHIIAIRSGHASNHALAQEMLKYLNLESV